jgi:hypothetical protein
MPICDVSSKELENDKGVKSRGICCVSEKSTREVLLERRLLARQFQKAGR